MILTLIGVFAALFLLLLLRPQLIRWLSWLVLIGAALALFGVWYRAETTLSKILGTLFGLPLLPLVGGLIGFLKIRQLPNFGLSLLFVSWLFLCVVNLPWTGDILSQERERRVNAVALENLAQYHDVGAIVVLGSTPYFEPPEYPKDYQLLHGTQKGQTSWYDVKDFALERARYAAFLFHRTQAPIFAAHWVMAGVLRRDFGAHVEWSLQANEASSTREEVQKIIPQLKVKNIKKIFLVTHAMHMPRAVKNFEAEAKGGIQIIPAPTAFSMNHSNNVLRSFLPNAGALRMSGRAWFEYFAEKLTS